MEQDPVPGALYRSCQVSPETPGTTGPCESGLSRQCSRSLCPRLAELPQCRCQQMGL